MDAKKTLQDFDEGMGKLARAVPKVVKGFNELHNAATADGALSAKQKELIAVGVGVSIRCHYCITMHIAKSLELGASREEIAEAIGVAILMGGGPALAYSAEAMHILDQLTARE